MKQFFRTLVSLALSIVFAYFCTYMMLLFSRDGEMDVMIEMANAYLHPTSGPLILRILFPLSWIAGFLYMTSVFSVNRDFKSAWINRMLDKPYSYREEREFFYKSGDWIALLIPCLIAAAAVPAFNIYGPYPLMFALRALLMFGANRFFIALNRYVWCRDRLGGLEGKRD